MFVACLGKVPEGETPPQSARSLYVIRDGKGVLHGKEVTQSSLMAKLHAFAFIVISRGLILQEYKIADGGWLYIVGVVLSRGETPSADGLARAVFDTWAPQDAAGTPTFAPDSVSGRVTLIAPVVYFRDRRPGGI
jgi:hypothetical protein